MTETQGDARLRKLTLEILRAQNTIQGVVIACLQMQIAYYAKSSGRDDAANKAMESAEKRLDTVQMELNASREELARLLDSLEQPTDV